MKKLIFTFSVILLSLGAFAQAPQKMSYQAVIRNSSDALVTNTTIGMQISILQGETFEIVVYVETQTPKSNANGLVTIEIGNGTVISGDFADIDWTDGPYYIKTETDPAGGTNYTITSTSQLLSVPYALHAKTAEILTSEITETDPVFTDWDKTSGITITESQISDLGDYIETETDPEFSVSVASSITTTDTAYWNNKLDSYTETDPVFNNSVAKSITTTDTAYWNNKQNPLKAGKCIIIKNDTISTNDKFYLGQDTLGGYVFYIYRDDKGEQHGLIVHPKEYGDQWSTSTTQSNGTSTYDGLTNHRLMRGISYIFDNISGIGRDWYLPSIDELILLWHARFHINKTADSKGTPIFSTKPYWSSTEYDGKYAYYLEFETGIVGRTNFLKSDGLPYRPIRAF